MFTGIVREVGRVRSVRDGNGSRRLRVEAPGLAGGLSVGDSIAVDGACLTVVSHDDEGFTVDVIGTTLSRTVAREYREGARVNLEPALAMGDGLDGHFVQGHVDGTGQVVALEDEGGHRLLEVRIPPDVWELTILHGSIALDGVSLTVNELVRPDRIRVALIPHTRERTTLGDLEPGDRLNVEGDLLGKYVGRIVGPEGRSGGGPEAAPGRDQ